MSRNIKEIGKELMGKSLNSFHRKLGLTQLEKNNEMQDGILDGILSQVDDAYIEKTEQSNVIHLDGSGDGVVVLDSIEGNTMVNLLKDLRADGAWVDNGNKFSLNIPTGSGQPMILGNLNYELKKDTVYTVILNVVEYTTGIPHVCFMNKENNKLASTTEATTSSIGLKKFKLTTKSDIDSSILRILPRNGIDNTYSIGKDILILEGDWTNREISASYFEGLQSSFEEKVNSEGKYEIEILSRYHYIDYDSYNNSGHYVKPIWTLSVKSISGYLQYFNEVLGYEACENLFDYYYVSNNTTIWINLGSFDPYEAFEILNIRIAEGEGKSNKIKLLLDEPLRSLENVKDKLYIKDNKLIIKRNYGELVLNNNSNIEIWNSRGSCIDFRVAVQDIKHSCKMLSDKFTYLSWNTNDVECCTVGGSSHIYVRILKSKLSEVTVQGFKTWLQSNPTKIVYELKEPIYEEVLNEYGEPILLEGYENGTIYIDSTIVPTTTVRYTPKMESFKTLKEVNNNNIMLTNDVNDNIIPYMMDVDLMIMEKEMALMSHKNIRTIGVKDMTSMQKRTQDMLTRLIKGKTLTEQECKTRVVTYLDAGKITDAQAEELMLLISEVYA